MAVYTLFGQPASPATLQADANNYEMGVQFTVSIPATVTGIWFFSPPGAVSLPTEIDIYDVPAGGLGASAVASWSGLAGSGWVKAQFATAPVVLPGYTYKACILANSSSNFYGATSHYWDTGPGQNGISNGPLSAPNNAGADHGQDSFATPVTVHAYPNQSFNAANYWIDVEITADPTQPLGNPSGGPWTLVFQDDFNNPVAGKPDPAVWATHFIEGDVFRQENGGTEIQWSAHNGQALSVANSILTITASFVGAWPAIQAIDPLAPNPSPSQITTPACPPISYLSGIIQSHPGFQCSYGYAEALMQLPNVSNSWPAFWRHPVDGGWPPEIDIEEATAPPAQTAAYHDNSGTTTTFGYPAVGDSYTNWHVFACRWTTADITFFLDGAQVATYTTAASITSYPMNLIFNLAVQNGAVSGNFPAVMKIEYVRAWTVTGVPAQPVISFLTPANGVPGQNGQLTVTFGAVAGATSYRATACPTDAAAAVPSLVDGPHNYATGAAGPLTLTGLTAGVPYNVTVSAINATGYSIESLPIPSLAPTGPVSGQSGAEEIGRLGRLWKRMKPG